MALLVSNFAKLWGEKNRSSAADAHGAIEAQQSEEAQAPVNTDEEFVSLQTVRKRLKVQESMLRSLFDSVVKSLTARVDDIVNSVASIKASLEYSQKTSRNSSPLPLN